MKVKFLVRTMVKHVDPWKTHDRHSFIDAGTEYQVDRIDHYRLKGAHHMVELLLPTGITLCVPAQTITVDDKKFFVVTVKEVHSMDCPCFAADAERAKEVVKESVDAEVGEGVDLMKYERTLDSDEWDVAVGPWAKVSP